MTYRVLVTCGLFEPGFRGGGPVRSVAQIIDTVSEQVDVTLVTGDRDLGAREPYAGLSGRWVPRDSARVFYLGIRRPAHWLRLWRDVREVPFDLLYVNSFWSPSFTMIPVLAARLGLISARATLIAPRGQLSLGALALKAAKKQLVMRLWSPLLNRRDVTWHASTELEAAEIRQLLPGARVEISVDQVALPRQPLPPAAHDGVARLVFIGRITAMKNLDLVLEALRELPEPVEFDIFGPSEDRAYWSRCQALVGRLPGTVRVRYRGELIASDVCRTFAGYDAFVFPTRGENFAHVIAESLSASCPVVCSDRTPWSDVLAAGGGRVLGELTAAGLRAELSRIAAMTPAARLRAREQAGDAYRTWRGTADRPNILDSLATPASKPGSKPRPPKATGETR